MATKKSKPAAKKPASRLSALKSLLTGSAKASKSARGSAVAAGARKAKPAAKKAPAKAAKAAKPAKVAKPAPVKSAKPAPVKSAKPAPVKSAKPAKAATVSAKAAPAAAKAAKGSAQAAKVQASAPAATKRGSKKPAAPVFSLRQPVKESVSEAVCREVACDGLATTLGYCRLHYIKNWKRIKRKDVILKEGKLNQYIEELVSKYPDKYLEAIRIDLANDKEFAKVIYDLELDESVDEFEAEGENVDALIDTIKRDFEDEGEAF